MVLGKTYPLKCTVPIRKTAWNMMYRPMVIMGIFSSGLKAIKVIFLKKKWPMEFAIRAKIMKVRVNIMIQHTHVKSHILRSFSKVEAGSVR